MFFESLLFVGISCLVLAYLIEKIFPCCEANAANIKCICNQY